MTKEEVKELLFKIKALYPKFELTKEVAEAWNYVLKDADNEQTFDKLMHYYEVNKFPPHVSDVKVKQEYNPAAIQYELIQQDIAKNKQEKKDPDKQKLIEANIKKIRGALLDD